MRLEKKIYIVYKYNLGNMFFSFWGTRSLTWRRYIETSNMKGSCTACHFTTLKIFLVYSCSVHKQYGCWLGKIWWDCKQGKKNKQNKTGNPVRKKSYASPSLLPSFKALRGLHRLPQGWRSKAEYQYNRTVTILSFVRRWQSLHFTRGLTFVWRHKFTFFSHANKKCL